MFRRVLAVAVVILTVVVPGHTSAQTDRLCFPEIHGIGNCIEGRFREYWVQNGGLPVFGYPVSPATMQQTAEGTFLTQYFERNRFELHPENARPYDVLLGRLGDDRLRQGGRDWQAMPKADPAAPHHFAETGHAIAHDPFWRYWSTHGLELDGRSGTTAAESLALFGLPLSEPAPETNAAGDTVLTQWFERARFEDHGAKGVLLGLLGVETGGAAPPAATPMEPTSCENAEICIHQHEQDFLLYRQDLIGKPHRVWITDRAGQQLGHEILYPADPTVQLLRITGRGRGYGLRLEPGDYIVHIAVPNDPTPPMSQPYRVLRTTAPQQRCEGIAAAVNATVDIYDTIPFCYSLNEDITTMLPINVALRDFAPGSRVAISVVSSTGQQLGRGVEAQTVAGLRGSEVELDACGCDFGIIYPPGDYTLIFEGTGGQRASVHFRILSAQTSVAMLRH